MVVCQNGSEAMQFGDGFHEVSAVCGFKVKRIRSDGG